MTYRVTVYKDGRPLEGVCWYEEASALLTLGRAPPEKNSYESLTKSTGASLARAFEIQGLDKTAVYELTLKSVGEGAFTRGDKGGPVHSVVCARRVDAEGLQADARDGFRMRQFLLQEGTPVQLAAATGLLCGFIDDDSSDNRGELELRMTPKVREEPARAKAPADDKALTGAAREAKLLFDEGVALFQRNQFREAHRGFKKCLEVEPARSQCLMMKASCSARMGDLEQGVAEYREFLRLAPNDEKAPLVQRILEDYEKSRKSPR